MSAPTFEPNDFLEVEIAFVAGGAIVREPARLRAVTQGTALLVGKTRLGAGTLVAVRATGAPAVFARVLRTAQGLDGSAGSQVRAVTGAFRVIEEQIAPACIRALGLTWPCGGEEVRKAYRRLAKRLHPDGGGSIAAFGRLRAEYLSALELTAA